jgi:hypothetical protein
MKPPTTEEKVIDDGYGLQFVGKTPEFIQEILNILQESQDRLEKCLESTIDTWEDIYEDDHLKYIKFMEDNLRMGAPWVDLDNPEEVAKFKKTSKMPKPNTTKDKTEIRGTQSQEEETAIAHRKAQIAVAQDALEASPGGPA